MHKQSFFLDDAIQDYATRVLADFYALNEMNQYIIFDDPRDIFFDLLGVINNRLERSILTLASLARANDDGRNGFRIHNKHRPAGVGIIHEGKHKPVLTVREACNKIIHAKSVDYVFEESKSHPVYQDILERDFGELKRTFIRPKILLAGENQSGKEWQAEIDVVLWIHAVLHYSISYTKTD